MFQNIKKQYDLELKRFKKKKFIFKTKLVLTIILPVFITILFIKVTKTFLQIKIRNLTAALPKKETSQTPAKPVPAIKTLVHKEIIQPVPVSNDIK